MLATGEQGITRIIKKMIGFRTIVGYCGYIAIIFYKDEVHKVKVPKLPAIGSCCDSHASTRQVSRGFKGGNR